MKPVLPGGRRPTSARISQIAYAEEETFRRTLAAGTTILDIAVAETKQSGGTDAPGRPGVPAARHLRLPDRPDARDGRRSRACTVDRDGVRRRLMQEQRQRAKADAKAKKPGTPTPSVYRDLPRARRDRRSPATTTSRPRRPCVGLIVDGESVDRARAGPGRRGHPRPRPRSTRSPAARSPTTGVIVGRRRANSRSLDVQRPVKGLVATPCEVVDRRVGVGRAGATPRSTPEWRIAARQAHSGDPPRARGAARRCSARRPRSPARTTSPGYLRLDFAWGQALSPATRSEIEEIANNAVRDDLPVSATSCRSTRPASRGAWPCSARSTATTSASSTSAARGRASCALAPTSQHSSQIGARHRDRRVVGRVRRAPRRGARRAWRRSGYLAAERAIVAELTGLLGGSSRRARRAGLRAWSPGSRMPSASSSGPGAQQVQAAAGDLTEQARDVNGVTVPRSRRGRGRRRRRAHPGARPARPARRRASQRRRDHRRGQGPAGRRRGDQRAGAAARHPGR